MCCHLAVGLTTRLSWQHKKSWTNSTPDGFRLLPFYCSLLRVDKSWLINEPVCTHAFSATIVISVVKYCKWTNVLIKLIVMYSVFLDFLQCLVKPTRRSRMEAAKVNQWEDSLDICFKVLTKRSPNFCLKKHWMELCGKEANFDVLFRYIKTCIVCLIYGLHCFSYSKSALI